MHEAVQFGTSTEVTEPTVTAVFRSGYTLGEKLVRPAVVVVTGPEHETAEPASSEPIVAAEAFGSASAGQATDQQAAGSAGTWQRTPGLSTVAGGAQV